MLDCSLGCVHIYLYNYIRILPYTDDDGDGKYRKCGKDSPSLVPASLTQKLSTAKGQSDVD